MAMVKIVSPGGWDFDGPVARLVKVGRDGRLGPNDRREFLKTASHVFLDALDHIKLADGEVPVHLVSHGATEAYGPNRNGDGFKEATCKKYAWTFEKYAQHYRNHKNKPHEGHPHFGSVKKAAYNDPMRRVELLVGMFADKRATDGRDNALVADKELEKLARGDDVAFSMACRVPFDVCSWCGNKARTRDDYCTAGLCKAGGCKDNLTRLIKVGNDVHQLHVDNPDPVWFDISTVFRPADRIAYGGKADWLSKAAADGWGGVVGGAKLAEDLGVMAPLAVVLAQDRGPAAFPTAVDQMVKLAHGLDALERRDDLALPVAVRRAFDGRLQGEFPVAALGEIGTVKCAEGLAALADRVVVLPLRDYARLAGRPGLAEKAAALLPGVYGRMIADGSLERHLAQNPLARAEKLAPYAVRSWAVKMASGFALTKEAVDGRAYLSVARDYETPKTSFGMTKAASDDPAAEELARSYACYKAAALHRIAAFDGDFLLTARLGVVQNQVV